MAEARSAGDIKILLADLYEGRPAPELFEQLYQELRQLATAYMRRERPDHSLRATELVHQAYLRLFEGKPFQWVNRSHLFRTMAKVMRRILVDHARKRAAEKHGGGQEKLPLDNARLVFDKTAPQLLDSDTLLDLHAGLKQLAAVQPRHHAVVELRIFAGLTAEEAADVLGVSERTVAADWEAAVGWLKRQMTVHERQ